MAIDFPTSPTNGQTFLSSGIVYTYDGTKWTAAASGGSVLGQGNSTAAVIDTGSDGRFVVTTEGSERLRVDSSGRLGVGSASPNERLEAVGAIRSTQTGSSGYYFRGYRSSTTSAFYVYDDGTNIQLTNEQAGALQFSTQNTERARIDSSGSLLVGTTSGSGRLTVAGNAVGVVSALTDGATITPNFSLANNFSVTLGGNRTLANPSNLTAGQAGSIVISQDGTGSRTLAFGSNWKFPGGTAPTLTTTANAVDVIAYYVESASRITARLIADVK